MSTVSIYGKKWLDLVFEGKNKEYGAYQLRQQSPKTTLVALFLGVSLTAGLGGLGLFLSSFGEKPIASPTEIPDDLTKPIDVSRIVHLPPKPEAPKAPKKAAAPIIKEDVTKKDLSRNITIVTKEDKPDDIKKNIEPPTTPIDTGNTAATGIGEAGQSNGSTSTTTGTAPLDPNGVVGRESLDKLPAFPGGMQKFYNYVGSNFEKPTLNESKTLTVHVSFVIEKDGRMTDIKVVKNPGSGLDREAIRVLKSLRTRWTPGMKNGQPVRTLYTLPITVRTE